MSTYNCNICNKEIQINPDKQPKKKGWEIWKWEVSQKAYQIPMELEYYEKIFLPKLVNKYPNEHSKLKTVISKFRDIENQFIKPIQEKHEEVLWKFFYKKGRILPHFHTSENSHSSSDKMCDSCSAELKTQLKPYETDEIEYERIRKKFVEVGGDKDLDEYLPELSDNEEEEIKKEGEKFRKRRRTK